MKAEGSTTGAGGIGATSPPAVGTSLAPGASQPQAGAAAQVGAAAAQAGAAAAQPQLGAAAPQAGAEQLLQAGLQQRLWHEKIRSSRQLFLQQLLQLDLQPLSQPQADLPASQPQLGAGAAQPQAGLLHESQAGLQQRW